MIKGKEIKFELAGNSSYPSSSYRGSTVAIIEKKARGERWEEGTSPEERPGGISSWTCLVPVRRFPSPSRSIRFSDVSHFRMDHVT